MTHGEGQALDAGENEASHIAPRPRPRPLEAGALVTQSHVTVLTPGRRLAELSYATSVGGLEYSALDWLTSYLEVIHLFIMNYNEKATVGNLKIIYLH